MTYSPRSSERGTNNEKRHEPRRSCNRRCSWSALGLPVTFAYWTMSNPGGMESKNPAMQNAPCMRLARPPRRWLPPLVSLSRSRSAFSPLSSGPTAVSGAELSAGVERGDNGRGAVRVRLSVPRPILRWIEMCASAPADPGGVRLKAQMMFCVPSFGTCRQYRSDPSVHQKIPQKIYPEQENQVSAAARRL
ncbi:hypothetical protein EDB85DRAFT_236770 [Lactarius pseudohatsudake]|nr:hypothetical protein EDB85DRAFT_236770 [Lactarius pseudohatsudake]